ncbi:LOW QUALITY PROTEIN: hypothetical protein U9M48_034627 [Paspalum notatum var. saurae]|uniref:DUF6598 domain-containing protein n=1 Tax=Paspalum notatum var. saurae TaxID=547442 RepID=A0AAQ3UCL9_PASNO
MEEAARKRDRQGEREGGAATRKKIDPAEEELRKQKMAEWRRMEKEEIDKYKAEFRAKYPNEDWSDLLAVKAREYREDWEDVWARLFGSFEDITSIPPVRFTDQPASSLARTQDTLHFFSVKNQRNRPGLTVAAPARDPIDRNRNIIFNRQRNDCQILTQEDPYLKTDSRAVVVCDPVYLEVDLKVKGSVEPEDKDLSLLAVPLTDYSDISSTCLINEEYTSKLSTLEVTFGYVVGSMEATISVHITEGSWPDDFSGHFTAQISSLEHKTISLLGYKIPVDDDGMIKLSRSVTSVEFEGELKVSVTAFRYHDDLHEVITVGEDEQGFRPKEAGKSTGRLDVGFCKMDVTVTWGYEKKRDPAITEEWKKQKMAEVRRMAKEEHDRYEAEFRAKYPNQDMADLLALQALGYREDWDDVWARRFGSFEDTTQIPPARFTDQPASSLAEVHDTLQFFSVEIKETCQGLQWPLQVFGIVAARDPIDRNRNIIFSRERNDCQILTQNVISSCMFTPPDPFLKLIGPSRAVVVCDPVYLEVALKVKGSVESEDKDLSLFAVPLTNHSSIYPTRLINKHLTFGYIVGSVEATISVHVTEGSWPDDFSGQFTARTSSLEQKTISLLGNKVLVNDDGMIKLSRSVASVEFEGELKVSVAAFRYDQDLGEVIMVGEDEERFRPKEAGRSTGRLDIGFCKMDVTVAWSLMSIYDQWIDEAPVPCYRRDEGLMRFGSLVGAKLKDADDQNLLDTEIHSTAFRM